jgi:hypothetical protein
MLTDHTELVQNAINAVQLTGGIVNLDQWGQAVLNVGQLEINEPIDALTRFTLRGNGVTLKALPGTEAILDVRRSCATVEGIHFVGNNGTEVFDGVRVLYGRGSNVRTFLLRECSFLYFRRWQVWIGNGEGIAIQHCQFRGNWRPNCTGVWIQRGEDMDSPRVVTIRDCQFMGGHRCGVCVGAKDENNRPWNIRVADCYFDACKEHSVYMQNTNQATLESLYLEGTDGQQEFVHLRGEDGSGGPYLVRKCTFDKYAKHVISLFGCKVKVEENHFAGSHTGPKKCQFEGADFAWADNTLLPP